MLWTVRLWLLCFFLPILPTLLGFSFGIRRLYVMLLRRFLMAAGRVTGTNHHPLEDDHDFSSNNSDSKDNALEASKPLSRQSSAILRNASFGTFHRTFQLVDVCDFATEGMSSVVHDNVTKVFQTQDLPSWNMLTRTGHSFEPNDLPRRLIPIWIIGVIVRYFVFLPFRFAALLLGCMFFVLSFCIIAMLPRKRTFTKFFERQCSLLTARMFALSWSAVIRYHNTENRPKNGIAVANHTSPVDCIVLAQDNCYSMVGQRHGGFIGSLQKTLSIAQTHIWFERSMLRDRAIVTQKMRSHIENADNNPMLIFPEGTCINNSAVMMFKQGSFSVGATICPVAIKYDPMFSDCFWNSSRQSFIGHLFSLMTTWAVVADVWYLTPMTQMEGEDSIDFANRVKELIAQRGGLRDMAWDGGLKRARVKSKYIEDRQRGYAQQLGEFDEAL